ncbi:hypothetical protein RHMOL_Rhmol09G0155700 [Rhododendron molle]|uniref:Uncharacterized protein n=1 Tax=Rhododendron molle TaxID=49168 RepID=A0ACC0MF57_RHOML|nr:hypothetical protein RHMOL_Rhmol09G0155700 [Rhododendron molle]
MPSALISSPPPPHLRCLAAKTPPGFAPGLDLSWICNPPEVGSGNDGATPVVGKSGCFGMILPSQIQVRPTKREKREREERRSPKISGDSTALPTVQLSLVFLFTQAEVSIRMESEGTSQSERTSRKRKHDRRLWTFAEEQALLAAMMESICDKYRAHNGFKPGYFNEVEKELKKILPGTTLKAQPNIESKVKNWKVQYAVILDITRLSGFGWNHTTNSIVVDDENVWKEYEKSNPKAKGLNGKSFPMYESWQFLFGRDRATGELAEDAAEVEEVVETYQNDANKEVDDMLNECYTPTFANGDTVFPRDTPFVDMSTSSGTPTSNAIPAAPRTNANTPRSNANTPTSNVVPGRPKKKAKVDANEASMHVAMANLLGESNTAFNKIADAVGYEDRLSAKREKVFTELMKLNLEMIDRFALNTMIVSAEENVDTFYGIPENYKQAWVEAVLSGQIKLKTT